MRQIELDEMVTVSSAIANPNGVIAVFLVGGGCVEFGRAAQAKQRHLTLKDSWWPGRSMTMREAMGWGGEMRGLELREPEPAPAVPAAPQPETAMDDETAIRTAADLLERATSLSAVIAERARDIPPLEDAAAREHSLGGLQSLANELLGDISRAQALAQAAATITQELRRRG